jgi:GNAT superfamily N-acetyltransferase
MRNFSVQNVFGPKRSNLKDLFFTPEVSIEFKWKEKFLLRAGSVRPHNKKQIAEGLRDMSPESIRNRFLGSKREFTDKELQYLTVLDGWNHYAIGIEERENLKRGVAIIRLVRSSHLETEGEVAITIIDEYQRLGMGSFLMDLIILAAIERKYETLSFTYLPQNEAIVKLIHRAGIPFPGVQSKDYVQLFLDLKTLNVSEIKKRLLTIIPHISLYK